MKQFYLKCYKIDESEWYLEYGSFLQLRHPEYLSDAINNHKICFEKYEALSIKNQLEMYKKSEISKYQAELILDYWQKYSKYEKHMSSIVDIVFFETVDGHNQMK